VISLNHRTIAKTSFLCLGIALLVGCSTPGKYRKAINKTANAIIQQKQEEVLGKVEPFSIETPEQSLRRNLLLSQDLLYSGPESLGRSALEEIKHWPKDDYLHAQSELATPAIQFPSGPLQLSLEDVLLIAAQNSRQYQSQKETLFRSALNLDLSRDQYRNTFGGMTDGLLSTNQRSMQSGMEGSVIGDISRRFLNGMSLTARIGMDLARILSPVDDASRSFFGDASVTVPLLRGAGRHIASESLTQSERNVVYAIYNFERYKKTFAVSVASEYFSVLQRIDQVLNSDGNYRGLITSSRRARRLADAGKMSPIDVDQSIQQELSARNGWISSQITLERRKDSLKVLLGIPADAQIELNRDDLTRLTASVEKIITDSIGSEVEEVIPPADAVIVLEQPTRENIGPMELEERQAIQIAFDNRLDLRVAKGSVEDAQRKVVVAADNLRAELTLLGRASVGEGRGIGSAQMPNSDQLNFDKGSYNALLSLDLPIERTAEIASYRDSLIQLERTLRDYQDKEDAIKLDIRNKLRDLQEARESLLIQAKAVELANRRVKSTEISLEAGRAIIRDTLEAKRDLLSSQNSFTAAKIGYRMAELELQRDLGVLEVDEKGLWKEFSPEAVTNEQ
jgi:outer membrane protein TolC